MTKPITFDKTDIRALRDYAEKMRELHFWVACNESRAVSTYTTQPYRTTQSALKVAIARGWAALSQDEVEQVYEYWVDCNESIAYCVELVANDKIGQVDSFSEEHDLPTMSDDERKRVIQYYIG